MELNPGLRKALIGIAAIMGVSYVAGLGVGLARGKRIPSDWTDQFVVDMDSACVRKGMKKELCACLSAEARATIPWAEWMAMVAEINERKAPSERTVRLMQQASSKCNR